MRIPGYYIIGLVTRSFHGKTSFQMVNLTGFLLVHL